MKKLSAVGMVVAAAALCSTPISLQWSPEKTPSLSIDSADARVGRPLTATSVAGVNRRVHRRAYRRAAVAGAAGYGYSNYYGSGYPNYGYGYTYNVPMATAPYGWGGTPGYDRYNAYPRSYRRWRY